MSEKSEDAHRVGITANIYSNRLITTKGYYTNNGIAMKLKCTRIRIWFLHKEFALMHYIVRENKNKSKYCKVKER